MDLNSIQPNANKNIIIDTPDYGKYARYPIKTHVIMSGEDLRPVMDKYVKENVKSTDTIIMSEKAVAISQGRAIPIEDIKPSKLAKLLVKFVYKSPYGIGLGTPWTMELAIRDVGVPRILLAAFCSAVTKPFGIRGVFYKVAGEKARSIDGPADYVIAPFNHYAKMAPLEPDKTAKMLSDYVGCDFVIIDANDLGVEVLGRSSDKIDIQFCKQVFKDNPLCQSGESTPIAIVRKVED